MRVRGAGAAAGTRRVSMPKLRTPREAALVTLRSHGCVTGAEPTAFEIDEWRAHYAKVASVLRRMANEKRDAEAVTKVARETGS